MSDFLEELQAAKSDEEREWLVIKFSLDSLEPHIRDAVWAAAIPQWFDLNLLGNLLTEEAKKNITTVFEKLISLAFVEKFQGRGFNVHERTRQILLNRMRQEDEVRYRELNARAADYCARQTGPLWTVAALYHRGLVKGDSITEQLVNQLIDWRSTFQYEKMESLTRSLLTESEHGRVSSRLAGWIHYQQGHLDDLYCKYESAKAHLEAARRLSTEDRLTAEALLELGHSHYRTDDYDRAKQSLNEALAIFRKLGEKHGEANALRLLGDVHLVLDEYEAAREMYEKARILYKELKADLGESNAIFCLGRVHMMLGERDEARKLFHEALTRYRKRGSRLGICAATMALGEISHAAGEYQDATEKYNEALGMYTAFNNLNGVADCMKLLANIDFLMGREDEGTARATEALQIFRKIGDRHGEKQCLDMLKTGDESAQ